MSELCNGYNISGNLAESVGRKYELSDATGVLFTTTESKRKAMDHAESLPAGDVVPEDELAEEQDEDESEE